MITACVGGVIRDVVAGEPSVLMRHELYVTVGLLAAGMFVGSTIGGVGAQWPAQMGFGLRFVVRSAAITWAFNCRRIADIEQRSFHT